MRIDDSMLDCMDSRTFLQCGSTCLVLASPRCQCSGLASGVPIACCCTSCNPLQAAARADRVGVRVERKETQKAKKVARKNIY